jgi:hypothetical protein
MFSKCSDNFMCYNAKLSKSLLSEIKKNYWLKHLLNYQNGNE